MKQAENVFLRVLLHVGTKRINVRYVKKFKNIYSFFHRKTIQLPNAFVILIWKIWSSRNNNFTVFLILCEFSSKLARGTYASVFFPGVQQFSNSKRKTGPLAPTILFYFTYSIRTEWSALTSRRAHRGIFVSLDLCCAHDRSRNHGKCIWDNGIRTLSLSLSFFFRRFCQLDSKDD